MVASIRLQARPHSRLPLPNETLKGESFLFAFRRDHDRDADVTVDMCGDCGLLLFAFRRDHGRVHLRDRRDPRSLRFYSPSGEPRSRPKAYGTEKRVFWFLFAFRARPRSRRLADYPAEQVPFLFAFQARPVRDGIFAFVLLLIAFLFAFRRDHVRDSLDLSLCRTRAVRFYSPSGETTFATP
ncbi:MAG: hypothetical protein R2734_18305 [Nocardioides sp.]